MGYFSKACLGERRFEGVDRFSIHVTRIYYEIGVFVKISSCTVRTAGQTFRNELLVNCPV